MSRTLLFSLLWVSTSAAATDWIIAPNGNDSTGKGTVASPFRTLARVLDPSTGVAKRGDTVLLRGPAGDNVYNECNARVRVPLTIKSYPGERAHLHCDMKLADSVVLQFDAGASGSTASNLELSGSAYYGVKINTDWYRGGGEKLGGATDIVLENLRVHDTGRDGIKITPKADRVTIRHSEISNTGAAYPPGTPDSDRNADGIDNVNGSKMVVEDNYIHDIATTGLYFKGGARDVIVQRNRIENTGSAGIRVGFDTGEEYFDPGENPGYYEAIGGIVRNNYIRNTHYAGIALHASKDALIENNTIVDTAKSGQAAIFFGITLQDGDEKAKRPATVNPTIKDNLIVQHGSGLCVAIRWTVTSVGMLSGLGGKPAMDHNGYYRAGGSCSFSDERPGPSMFASSGLASWQGNEDADRNSVERPFAVDEKTGMLDGSAAHSADGTAARQFGVVEPMAGG